MTAFCEALARVLVGAIFGLDHVAGRLRTH